MSISEKLRIFLKKENETQPLSFDSLSLAELVAYIQREFSIVLNLDDVIESKNFTNIVSLCQLIERRLNE